MWAATWLDANPVGEQTLHRSSVADYTPGQFFRRELPCLLDACDAVESATGQALGGVVIDGNVRLDQNDMPGLGLHLHRALDERCPIVGIAKAPFRGLIAAEVRRGTSTKPLWVTSAGIDEAEAARVVAAMAGEHRIPTLAKRADQLSRV